MIFDQNTQSVTNRNRSYGAKRFGVFWVKMAVLGQKVVTW